MKKLIKIFVAFLGRLFSSSDEVSMKRFVGLLLFIILINLSYFVGLKLIDIEIWKAIESWLRDLLYSADLLLGLGAVIDGTKIVKGSKDKQNQPPAQP